MASSMAHHLIHPRASCEILGTPDADGSCEPACSSIAMCAHADRNAGTARQTNPQHYVRLTPRDSPCFPELFDSVQDPTDRRSQVAETINKRIKGS